MGEHHIWGQKHVLTLLGGQSRYLVIKLEKVYFYKGKMAFFTKKLKITSKPPKYMGELQNWGQKHI